MLGMMGVLKILKLDAATNHETAGRQPGQRRVYSLT
jgi:hypothetical protein